MKVQLILRLTVALEKFKPFPPDQSTIFTKIVELEIFHENMVLFLTIRDAGYKVKVIRWHEESNSYSAILEESTVSESEKDKVIKLFLQKGWEKTN